jgi:hypothetical protein
MSGSCDSRPEIKFAPLSDHDDGHDLQTAFAALLPFAPVGSPGRETRKAADGHVHGAKSTIWLIVVLEVLAHSAVPPLPPPSIHWPSLVLRLLFFTVFSLLHLAAAPVALSASHKSRLKSSFARPLQLPLFFQPPHHHPSAHSPFRHGFRGQDTRGFGQAPQARGHCVPIWHRRGTLLPSTCVSKG